MERNGNIPQICNTSELETTHKIDLGIVNPSYSDELDVSLSQNDNSIQLQAMDHHNVNNNDNVEADTKREEKPEAEFRSLVPFCLLFGTGSLFSQSISVYLASQITVLEKAFGLSSTKSGILLSANDIGFVATVLCASHFLKNFHGPRVLATCIFVFGVSGMLTSLSHFISGKQMTTQNGGYPNTSHHHTDRTLCVPHEKQNFSQTCNDDTMSEARQASQREQDWVMLLISLLMVVQGVAKAPRSSVSSLYIDNNSTKVKTGFYIGILTSFQIFGPFIAVLSGGLFSKIPVDLRETSITPDDPRFIGAWWIGFLVFGAGALLTSVPLYFFPASLRRHNADEEKKVEYANTGEIEEEKYSCIEELKDMPRSMLRVVIEPVYTLLLASTMVFLFAIMALASFGPKYIENQFHIPTWKANVVLGINKLVTTVFGTLIGGVVTRRFRLNMRSCIKMILIVRAAAMLIECFNFVLGCDGSSIVGLDIKNSTLDMQCDCSDAQFLPVCADGQTFFSPCHAGCQSESNNVYHNCSASLSGNVHPGTCEVGCSDLFPFILVNALASLIGTAGIAPSFVVVLRCVQEKDRAMAIGLQSFILSLAVFLPAPIVYGKMFDSTCRVWGSTCNGEGACSIYNLTDMRHTLVSMEIGLKAIGFILALLGLWCAKRKEDSEKTTTSVVIKAPKPPVPQPRISLTSQ